MKYNALGQNDYYFLLIALLSVLFMALSLFANNIIAFTPHSLRHSRLFYGLTWQRAWFTRIFYFMALPVAGIAIQHVIQKRYDGFAQQLMYKLLEERKP